MPLRRCDFPGCSKAAERDCGNCMICSSHRCLEHLAPEFHACPSEVSVIILPKILFRSTLTKQDNDPDTFFVAYDSTKEGHLQALLDKVNFDALKIIASHLYGNVACALPAVDTGSEQERPVVDSRLVSDQMGGQNCHLDIRFDDGTVWIARLRLEEPTIPPHATQEKILSSEVATLHFLAHTTVPAPKVFYYTTEQNEIGTPFLLMEKMPGKPLEWSECSAQQRTKVMAQLVDMFLELEKHPLPATGSLSGSGLVGPFVQSHVFLSPSKSIGPFEKLEESLTSILEHEIKMIEGGELSTLAVDNYLTHLWRLKRIPDLVMHATDVQFYIKHFDDKGDHILVDEHHNITGIIDWEFASAESKPLAFGSPCMMWPVGEYYDGSNQLSHEEVEFAHMFQRRGREDMAQMIMQSRKWQRFLFFLGSLVSPQREEFEALFQGLRKAFDGEDVVSYSDWRSAAISQASKDPILEQLLRAERRIQGQV